MHTISIETRSFEIAYPMDYESRIRNFFPNTCRKCGETTEIHPMKARPRDHEAEMYGR
jgi:hypothetical protein